MITTPEDQPQQAAPGAANETQPEAAIPEGLQLPDDLRAEILAARAKEYPVTGRRRELEGLALVAEKAIKRFTVYYQTAFQDKTAGLPPVHAQYERVNHHEYNRGMTYRQRVIELRTVPGNEADRQWLLRVLDHALQGDLLSEQT